MRYLRAALLIAGATLLLCGLLATIEKHYRPDGILSILPATFLPLPHRYYIGHEMPVYLNLEGIAAVYIIPGAMLAGVALLLMWRVPRSA